MLDHLFDFQEIRVTSKRPESRERFAAEMSRKLGKPVVVKDTSEATVRYVDIIFGLLSTTTRHVAQERQRGHD